MGMIINIILNMDDKSANHQIDQMVSFILREAKEKSDEIRSKTEQEYQIDLNKKVKSGKESVRSTIEKLKKKRQTERKIEDATANQKSRLEIMKSRQDIIEDIKHK